MSTFIALYDQADGECRWTGEADTFSAAVRYLWSNTGTDHRAGGEPRSPSELAAGLWGVEITQDQSDLLREDSDAVGLGEGKIIQDIRYVPRTRTGLELAEIKNDWRYDPDFGLLEDAAGFEDHYEELRAWRVAQEERLAAEREAKSLALADDLGCPGNIKLAEFVESLLSRIRRLERKIA
jgi:hypothetical protein